MSRIIASREVCSPIQIVCNYLFAVDNDTISSTDLCFVGAKCNVSSLSPQQCSHLLQKYFFESKSSLSFTILNIFLNFTSNQLIKFTLR